MSAEESAVPDMVSKYRGQHPLPEMTMIGYGIGALLFFLFIPLIPFALAYLVLSWLVGNLRGTETDGR
jgi:hypothetical protein